MSQNLTTQLKHRKITIIAIDLLIAYSTSLAFEPISNILLRIGLVLSVVSISHILRSLGKKGGYDVDLIVDKMLSYFSAAILYAYLYMKYGICLRIILADYKNDLQIESIAQQKSKKRCKVFSRLLFSLFRRFWQIEFLDYCKESIQWQHDNYPEGKWIQAGNNSLSNLKYQATRNNSVLRPLVVKPREIPDLGLIDKKLIFWPFPAFNELLLFGGINLDVFNKKLCLKISLNQQKFALFNTLGKIFLSDKFSDQDKKKYSAFLQNSLSKPFSSIQIPPSTYPYRWASAGILPIIKWRSHYWCAFVLRVVDPYGLNIFIGGSENREEYQQLNKLTLREFSEELLVLNFNGKTTRKLISLSERSESDQPRNTPSVLQEKAFTRMHDKLREEQDKLKIEMYDGEPIDAETVKTPFEVQVVQDLEGKKHPPLKDVIFTFNPFEHGIDVVTPIVFELNDDDVLLFGEIWERGYTPLRNPIILLRIDLIIESMSNARCELKDTSKPSLLDVGLDQKKLTMIKTDQYHIFEKDIELRLLRKLELSRKSSLTPNEKKELDLHEKWLAQYGSILDYLIKQEKNPNPTSLRIDEDGIKKFFTFCPPAWKTLELMYNHNILHDVGSYLRT